MNILIIGDVGNLNECRQKFGDTHVYTLQSSHVEAKSNLKEQEVLFDFVTDQNQMQVYRDHPNLIAFLNTSKISLTQISNGVDYKIACSLFGFAGLPTFLYRPILETSLYKLEEKFKLEAICKKLNTEFQIVQDKVGLVTPRVICMIINEAYFTVEEGTATREDIDLAMKLGTNYPYGPFEWAQKIGIKNVYEVLHAVYEDTKDERYRICSILTEESTLP